MVSAQGHHKGDHQMKFYFDYIKTLVTPCTKTDAFRYFDTISSEYQNMLLNATNPSASYKKINYTRWTKLTAATQKSLTTLVNTTKDAMLKKYLAAIPIDACLSKDLLQKNLTDTLVKEAANLISPTFTGSISNIFGSLSSIHGIEARLELSMNDPNADNFFNWHGNGGGMGCNGGKNNGKSS